MVGLCISFYFKKPKIYKNPFPLLCHSACSVHEGGAGVSASAVQCPCSAGSSCYCRML